MERNSKYLLSLVNQLMDFRKVESGKLEIVKTRGNFLKFIDSLITPFEVFSPRAEHCAQTLLPDGDAGDFV